MLQEFDHLPPGLLSARAGQLESILGGPALIHLSGRPQRARVVCVLLHGNEPTGWEAVRSLLAKYDVGGGETPLPRSLSLFIGNVQAAARGVRRLDGQPDYNRVWPGCDGEAGPEHDMMRQVVDRMRGLDVFASVDVHNNTGLNPHYACINVIDNRFLHLAAMFSRTVVYFRRPCGVQSMAMAEVCPSVTLECGKPGQPHGVEHAAEYLDACLHLSDHPQHPVPSQDVDLFHTVAIVKAPDDLRIGFEGGGLDLKLPEDLDRLNFRELPRSTALGRIADGCGLGLLVQDEKGRDVSGRYLQKMDGELCLQLPVMPSMLTRDLEVVRQDCFCYLMERYDDHLL